MYFRSALVSLAVITATSAAAAETQVRVPSDPKAQYWILAVDELSNGNISVTSKRSSSSGTSFAIREIDCEGQRFRYLADADTLEELSDSQPSPNFGPFVDGSISEVLSSRACQLAGRN